MKRFDAVIFDLDGTLANTFALVLDAFNCTVSAKVGRSYNLEELKAYFGPPEVDILKSFFPAVADYQSAIDCFHRINRERGHLVEPVSGIRPVLEQLKSVATRLAVYTGAGRRAGFDRLAHVGLTDYFERVLGGDEVTRHKPHPEGIWLLLKQFGVTAERCAYVGDALADVEAGRAAGVVSIAVGWGATTPEQLATAKPDYLCQTPAELHQVLCGADHDNNA